MRIPRRTHVPAVVAIAAAEREPRTLRQRIAGTTAAASVCGLVLAFALPFTNTVGADAAASATSQQRLFSGEATELPGSLAEVSAVAVDDSSPVQFAFRPEALVNYPFSTSVQLTDPFGYRTAPIEQFHDAQDFAADAGTPIQIIADGTVLEAGPTTDGCGFGLMIEHHIDGKTVTSRYCHMQYDSHAYDIGDTVEMGDEAGSVGSTGLSFGAHLHLALRVDDEAVDPMPFIAKYYGTSRSTS